MENLIRAFTIFLKYGNQKYPTHCEHDVMYVVTPYSSVSKEDRAELKKLGFDKNTEDDGFMSLRYGSC